MKKKLFLKVLLAMKILIACPLVSRSQNVTCDILKALLKDSTACKILKLNNLKDTVIVLNDLERVFTNCSAYEFYGKKVLVKQDSSDMNIRPRNIVLKNFRRVGKTYSIQIDQAFTGAHGFAYFKLKGRNKIELSKLSIGHF